MINMATLVGKVREIYEDHIDLGITINFDTKDEMLVPIYMNEEFISHLLLNNVCGVQCKIIMENELIKLICHKLTVLDARGKENDGN